MVNSISLIISLLFCMFFSDHAYSESIELANPIFQEEFNKLVRNTYNLKSARQLNVNRRIKHGDKLLHSKYKLALDGLMDVDLKNSIQLFKEITSYFKTGIFSKKSKYIISNSFLHLASIEKENLSFWSKEASLFDSSYEPSSEVFNPVVIKAYKEQAKLVQQLSKVNVSVTANSDIFINGNKDNLNLALQNNYYVTIYKDGFRPLAKTMSAKGLKEIKKIKLKRKFLGTCQKPQFKTRIDKIYFSPSCTKSRFTNDSFNLASDLIPDESFKKIDLSIKKNKTPLLKKKSTWIVIGASILATSVVMIINDQNKNSSSFKPVHRVSSK